ncbi:MAG: hypothetical protein Harvfovirus3_54 [Harvfovirus sp.]|uniref:Uncharacterized protein n=1 Tax=Harvfovirus sp. TaxID=2487768 RepID=A0A3G5A539_9VIRU|nr:MAG: hypothetical protein Harvfovirus3_54 [Harvfovirus sp.]
MAEEKKSTGEITRFELHRKSGCSSADCLDYSYSVKE